jgi:glucan biosynthesis protein C
VEAKQSIASTMAPVAPAARLLFADHLKAALVILVVLHHIAVIYAGNTPFYYVEPAYSELQALLALVFFQLFNQAYFMGFFFFLSGYLTPGSYDRKGPGPFLRDRLIRLGIPILVFMFVLGPIAATGIWKVPSSLTGIRTPLTWRDYPRLVNIGPLWFAVMLLAFDSGYTALRLIARRPASQPERPAAAPRYWAIGAFVVGLALASYLIRIVWPLGKYVFSFPTLAYLPQYLSFFILGTFAVRRDWLRTIPSRMGWVGFAMALGASIILFPLSLTGLDRFVGGGTWQSAVYTLWDSTFSVGICLALIVFFRRFFNRPGRLGGFLSRHAFTVYIIHPPTLVFLAIALRNLQLEHLLKFGLLAIIAVPVCFAVAFLVRKIPLASRVV